MVVGQIADVTYRRTPGGFEKGVPTRGWLTRGNGAIGTFADRQSRR